MRLRKKKMVMNAINVLNSNRTNKPHVEWVFPSPKLMPKGLNTLVVIPSKATNCPIGRNMAKANMIVTTSK